MRKFISFVLIFSFIFSSISLYQQPVSALSGSQFNPGRIIDDTIFYNSQSMSAEQIQQFLNSKLPVCDTNGTQMHNSTQTRAQWAAANSKPLPPYTCLKDYIQSVPTVTNGGSDLCKNSISGGTKSAAQIIWDAAQACGINPQVLIVMLQKEQSLITDTWPWPIQYSTAMGYACPDSGPNNSANCDSEYFGFFNQVYNAAKAYRRYAANPNTYNYKANRNNTILYHPNSACGTSNIFIANQATASLYIYTPYRPNQAALDNLYGTGDGCSAYGNRNFWRMFNDWFGTTVAVDLPGCSEATNTTRACIWMLRNPNGQSHFTSQVNVRDSLVAGSGYDYIWSPFFGNATALAGNLPVYRLTKPNGGSLITTSKLEYDYLSANGFGGQGIDFYADPASSNSGFPVYRLYKSASNEHIWVKGATDRAAAINNWGFADEGVAFNSISHIRQETAPPAGRQLVYRFYIPQTYAHFWTTDLQERDNLITAGYNYEGVSWQGSSITSDLPVYRLYAPAINQHLYTTSIGERDNLAANHGWQYEGISYYVSKTATSKPTYRLYAPSLGGVHLLTGDVNERNTLLQNGFWIDEGIAWYQP